MHFNQLRCVPLKICVFCTILFCTMITTSIVKGSSQTTNFRQRTTTYQVSTELSTNSNITIDGEKDAIWKTVASKTYTTQQNFDVEIFSAFDSAYIYFLVNILVIRNEQVTNETLNFYLASANPIVTINDTTTTTSGASTGTNTPPSGFNGSTPPANFDTSQFNGNMGNMGNLMNQKGRAYSLI
jgi:hypothetical protein